MRARLDRERPNQHDIGRAPEDERGPPSSTRNSGWRTEASAAARAARPPRGSSIAAPPRLKSTGPSRYSCGAWRSRAGAGTRSTPVRSSLIDRADASQLRSLLDHDAHMPTVRAPTWEVRRGATASANCDGPTAVAVSRLRIEGVSDVQRLAITAVDAPSMRVGGIARSPRGRRMSTPESIIAVGLACLAGDWGWSVRRLEQCDLRTVVGAGLATRAADQTRARSEEMSRRGRQAHQVVQ